MRRDTGRWLRARPRLRKTLRLELHRRHLRTRRFDAQWTGQPQRTSRHEALDVLTANQPSAKSA